VSNALRYGGGPVELTMLNDEHCATISVSDCGPGVAPEVLPHIFERFRRAGSSAGGLGLGLYIARQIVEAHGGTIGVESAVGKGATFTVALPFNVEPLYPPLSSARVKPGGALVQTVDEGIRVSQSMRPHHR
jgi:signal transduction histidine kinase